MYIVNIEIERFGNVFGWFVVRHPKKSTYFSLKLPLMISTAFGIKVNIINKILIYTIRNRI